MVDSYPDHFNGYCPESWLFGEEVRMRLNQNDFYESEKTGLQIAIPYRGVQAVIMKMRGKGKFRIKAEYADELNTGEFLFAQTSDSFPYSDDTQLIGDEALRNYFATIKL